MSHLRHPHIHCHTVCPQRNQLDHFMPQFVRRIPLRRFAINKGLKLLFARSVTVSPKAKVLQTFTVSEAALSAKGRNIPPHELVFGLFLFITWARLFLQGEGASPPAFSFLALLLGSYLVACWAPGHSTPGRWRVRLLWYPAIMGISFSILPSSIHLLQTPSADGLLGSLGRRRR